MTKYNATYAPAIAYWLFACAGLVMAMIIVGAITRLTESGLSMVEWRPLIGALPPLNEAEWQRVFALYQETPEYRKENFWMDVQDFKVIFFWEWFHRFLGRLIGLAYALPLIWFWVKGKIPPGSKGKLLTLLILGALQAGVGWYMVQSGLVDRPSVSHYRLAAHLGLALLILAGLVWTGLSLNQYKSQYHASLFSHALFVLGFFILTVFWGAYTAGLDAGLVYNETFPKMGGHWLPPDIWHYEPRWVNFFENHSGVQFAHRWLAMITAAIILSFWGHVVIKKAAFPALHALLVLTILQIGLGIATLLSGVSLPLAVAHQANAALILIFLTISLFHLGKKQNQSD